MTSATAITVRDGAQLLRFKLNYAITSPAWRMWIARKAFGLGAWAIGERIRLEKS